MNTERRQRVSDVQGPLDDAIGDLDDIINDEQDALDALPESLQDSSRGLKMQDAIDVLESIKADIESAKDRIVEFDF